MNIKNNNFLSGVSIDNNKNTVIEDNYDINDLSIYNVEGGNMYYTEFGDVVGCDSSIKTVNIPSSINGVNIKGIGVDCFALSSVEKIEIPSGVEYIGSGCFANCEKLEFIYIPSSVNIIGEYVFYNCNNVTIQCDKGSVAEKYAIDNNIKYKIV